MKTSEIKAFYARGNAKWYDWLQKIWRPLISAGAEKELATLLSQHLTHRSRILDLGCGTGHLLDQIMHVNLPFQHYLGIDLSQDMLSIARDKFANKENIEFQEQSISTFSNINQSFDTILSSWVLSHLDNPAEVANNAQQLLAPGGKLILIFFSQPKWYLDFWVHPFSKYILKATHVSQEEILKIKNVTEQRSFVRNITTLLVCGQ
jgi:ubiquinone/menaquinone biosynthesis C-methylase UbiE